MTDLKTEGRNAFLIRCLRAEESKNEELTKKISEFEAEIDDLNWKIDFLRSDREYLIEQINRMNSSDRTFDDGYKRCLSDIKGYISRKQEGEF